MKIKEWIFLTTTVFFGFFLRFYHVDTIPPGLYIDEISIGNNAYDILVTGKDEYGERYPLVFKSLGDYKMPLYIYATSLSMAVFGKNELAVRFPAVMVGTLSIFILYFFLKELFFLDRKKYSDLYETYVPYLASFLLAISSWHLQFSRGGFEVMLAASLFLFASWMMALFWKTQKIAFLLFGYFCYVLTMYSYHAFRVLALVTITTVSIIIFKKFIKQRQQLFISVVIVVLVSIPLLTLSHGLERFTQTSSFVVYEAHSLLEKIKIYPMVYLKNYLSFFSLDFLFTFGDGNGRHQISGFGLLYRWQLPFFVVGVIILLKKRKSLIKNVVFFLLFISPLAASVARPSPHSLRDLLMVVPLMILIAFGIVYIYERLTKFRKFSFFILLAVAIFEFSMYLHHYYVHYPQVNINDWGSGYKEIITDAQQYKGKYEAMIVDANFEKINNYFTFYTDEIKPYIVDFSWKKPKEWNAEKVLFIRRYYGPNSSDKIFHRVLLPNTNKDIVAEFWKIQ